MYFSKLLKLLGNGLYGSKIYFSKPTRLTNLFSGGLFEEIRYEVNLCENNARKTPTSDSVPTPRPPPREPLGPDERRFKIGRAGLLPM